MNQELETNRRNMDQLQIKSNYKVIMKKIVSINKRDINKL